MENAYLVRFSELIGIFCKKTQGSKVAVKNHIGSCNKAYKGLQICPCSENMCNHGQGLD